MTQLTNIVSDTDLLRIAREGMPLITAYGTKTGAQGANDVGVIFKGPVPTSCWVLKGIHVSCNQACKVKVEIIAPTYTISAGMFWATQFGAAGGDATFPLDGYVVHEGQNVRVTILAPASDASFIFECGVSGDVLSSDLTFEAPRRMLVIGDSIHAGAHMTNAENHYTFRLRDWLIQNTTRLWRPIRKAESSYTSSHLEAMRSGNYLNVQAPDLIIYGPGMNDTNAATYDANLEKFLNWATLRWPKALVIVCGPTRRTDAQETVLVAIRAAAAARVAALNNNRVVYRNLGDIWSAAEHLAKAPDGTHPVAGQADMANALIATLTANGGRLLKILA